MKKLLALLLVALMWMAAVPLSVSATESDYVTLDAAYEMGRTGTSATIDLHFSEPVRFVNTSKSIVKLCDSYNPNPGVNGSWQHHTHNTDSGIYLNPQTGADGNTYSKVIRLTFSAGTTSIVTANSILPASGAMGVRILEGYQTNTAYDGILNTAAIVGMSGNPVKATHKVSSPHEVAWKELTRAITLDDVQFDGWNATLTFSAPITFASLDNAIRSCCSYTGTAPQYQPKSVAYLGDVTVKDGASYSKTVRVAFYNKANTVISGATHGYAPKYADYGVRLIEYTNYDSNNGMISTKNIVGLNGEPVAGTHKDGTKDVTFVKNSAIRSLTQFVKAEVADPSNYTVLMSFDKAVHVFDKTFFKLTWSHAPNASAAGHYQFQVDNVSYINPTELNGLEYSKTLAVTFIPTAGYDIMPTNAGVRIVEYGKSGDLGNCSVSTEVIADINGMPIAANNQDGSVDIAWQAMTFTGTTTTLLGAQQSGENKVLVDFSRPVTLNDINGITVGDAVAQSAASASGAAMDTQWEITFADALNAANGATIVFASAAMTDGYGCGLRTPAEALLDPWQDENIDYGEDFSDELSIGSAYHFMNTDTGRALTVGTVDEWILERIDGVNMYVLKDSESGQYLSLAGATPVLSDYPCKILLRKADNDRYQIVIGGKLVLADSDGGEDDVITLTRIDQSSQDISTGWYLTESGQTRPLRVMPLGDSITYGVNQDLASSDLRLSYRATLSQELTEYLGRVVFVGSEVTASTTLSETRLLRHAGFPGYVVTDLWNEAGHPGVDDLIDGLCDKYAPDVVLLMLSTNDLTRMVKAGTTSDADLADQITRYKAFIDTINATMDYRGTILCSSLTPRGDKVNSTTMLPLVNAYNLLLEEMVYDLAKDGTKIVFNDNFSAVNALGAEGLCSDTLHLSLAGSEALAAQYLSTFKKVYTQQATKKSYKVTVNLCDGAQYTVLSGNLTDIVPGGELSLRIAARTGFGGTPVITVDGQEVQGTVITLRGITADHAITVSGLTPTVGVADLQELLNNAQSGDTVTLKENYDTREYYKVVVVPAGVTLDLNGQYVYANNFLSFGDVVDSTEGSGLLVIGKTDTDAYVCLTATNSDLPIYDAESGGYRLFSYEMVSHTPRSAVDGSYVKFGLAVKFENLLAYELLAKDPDVNLLMQMQIGDDRFEYIFRAETVARYANAVLAEPTRVDSIVLVLTVTNVDTAQSGTVFNVTPVVASATKVKKGAAVQNFVKA